MLDIRRSAYCGVCVRYIRRIPVLSIPVDAASEFTAASERVCWKECVLVSTLGRIYIGVCVFSRRFAAAVKGQS